jgi:AcrR family transcriptional regulator
MNPPATARRQLSTADERREAVLTAGMKVFAARGYNGTPTSEVAKAAGISHAYLFRLFPTKAELVQAIVERSNQRIYDTFAEAAAQAKAEGADVHMALGHAYVELLEDRDLLLSQIHAHAAGSEPAIGKAMRKCFERLFELVKRETGAPDQEVREFFAQGMLLNVMAAIGAAGSGAHWAKVLMGKAEDA